MNLPLEAITEFQEIYKRKLGITLTTGEAGVRAENFLRLLTLLVEGLVAEEKNTNINKNEK
jgi:hypothetical protein